MFRRNTIQATIIMLFLSFCSLAGIASAALCSPTVYPYASQNVSVPFTAVTTAQTGAGNTQIQPPKISGTFSIVNGCSFVVKAFTFTPNAGTSYTFYGILKTNASLGVQLIPGTIAAATGADVTFNFLADAAVLPPYSFDEISGVEIFDTTNQIVWAVATLPPVANVTTPTTAPTASKPTSVPTSLPTIDSVSAKSGALKTAASVIGFACMILLA